MTKFRAYLAYGIKKIWTLIALLLVVSAVAISLLRFSLPYLDQNKHLVEDYISQNYAAQLKIGSISAVWTRVGPSLVLNNIALEDASNEALTLAVDRVFVEVDFWQSISTMSLQSKQFELNGVEMEVNMHLASAQNDQTNVVSMVMDLFFERLERFLLTDSQLTINTEHNSQTYDLKSVQWLNQENRHQAVGQMQIAQLANNTASFVLDLTGDVDNLNGQFYAQGDALDFSPWLNEFTSEDQSLLNSQGNFKIWTQVENSAFTEFQVSILPSEFEWQSQDDTLLTKIQGGSIVAEPYANGWAFNINDLVLSVNDKSVVTRFIGQVDANGNLQIGAADRIRLSPLMELVPLFVNSEQAEMLSRVQPRGFINQLDLQARNGDISATAKLSNLSWQAVNNLPGLSNLDAELHWYKNQGRATFFAENAELATKGLLEDSLALEQFSASFHVYSLPAQKDSVGAKHTRDWYVHSDDIQFNSDKVSFTQQVNFDVSSQHLLLATQIDSLPVVQVPELFPNNYMGKNTSAYLTRALKEQDSEENARVSAANLIWQGPLDAFPFEQGGGVFQAGVEISNASFLFSSQWPSLTNLDINLLFENDSLTMRSSRSTLKGVELSNLVATIPSLSKGQILNINAQATATGSGVAELMQASNMSASLGKLLSQDIKVKGALQTELALSIPLNSEQVKVSGQIALADNQISIPILNLDFTEVAGAVTFVNDEVSFDDLSVKLLDQPLTLSLSGQDSPQGYQADISLSGKADFDQLLAEYSPALDEYIDGFSDINAQVELLIGKSSFEYVATLNAALNGTNSRLPEPFGFADNNPKRLWLDASGNNTASVINTTLGSQVAFTGVLPHAERQFSRAHLAIGEDPLTNMGVGFSISAELPHLDVNDWYSALSAISKESQQKGNRLLGKPERLFVNANHVKLGGREFDNLRFVGKQREGDWELDVGAKQLQAQVYIPNDYLDRGIALNADFIRLERVEDTTANTSDWRPKDIPPFRFRCAQCSLGKIDLGKVSIDAVRNDLGLAFERIQMETTNGRLTADGLWQFNQDIINSSFSGELVSNDFGQLLKQNGFDSGIKDSQARFEFTLTWPDMPWAVNKEELAGDIDWSLTDGYLTEVSDKGSRIFTLFSLNSLVRKLSLDFRDVFAQGFFYDDIKGTMQIAKGKANTDDTVVDGGAGEITINGYTDLAKNKLNYTVSFTPNVTGSLPVLMYFMVSPPTALAALALDQVLTSAKVISNINYSVTGSLEQPIVSEIGRDSTEVELPARVQSEPTTPSTETEFVPPVPLPVNAIRPEDIDG